MNACGKNVLLVSAFVTCVWVAGCLEMMGFDEETEDTEMSRSPQISFGPDEGVDRIVINSATSDADWYDLGFAVRGCEVSPASSAIVYAGSGSTMAVKPNVRADGSGAALNSPKAGTACGPAAIKNVATGPNKVAAGDYVDFCATPKEAGVKAVQLQILDTRRNAVLFEYRFFDIAGCGASR